MVLKPKNIRAEDIARIGGKAANLLKLYNLGINVPEWVVIPYGVCNELEQQELSDKIKILINEAVSVLPNTSFYAVRSSALEEDGNNQSYAGLFDSYLFVTKAQLHDRIIAVLKSVKGKHLESYLKASRLPQMAVIIQVMINADSSGVAFSINPVTGNRKQMIVNSLFGLGEGLVSGKLIADNYQIEKDEIIKEIGLKQQKTVPSKSGGFQYVDLKEEQRKLSSLQDKQLFEIRDLLKKLYKHLGKYQDIEFSYFEGKLYVLQTRPITTHTKVPDKSGQYFVWDNSNIIESYPGITSALTFSFITKMYERVYIQLLELFGVSQTTIRINKHVFSNMLGIFNGRVYYNLYSWYKVLSLLPGFSLNAQFMEKMMGVKERFELTDYVKPSKTKDIFNLIRMAFGLFTNIRKLPRNTKKFNQLFLGVIKEFEKQELNSLNAAELVNLYYRLEDELLTKWEPPLVNDFFAMIYFGMVPKLLEKYLGVDYSYLQNDLFCGANDIVSAEPKRLIDTIVANIRATESVHVLFKIEDSKEVWKAMQKLKNNDILELINEYLFNFGDRCVGELKLETKTYKQNPEKFIEVLKSHLLHEKPKTKTDNAEIRNSAEERVKRALRWRPVRRIIFNHVLKKARTLVSNRENLRFRRTQAYGMIREIFNAIGKKLYAESILSNPDHVFHLTISEIFDFVQGKSITSNLQALIDIRLREKEENISSVDMDERFETFGIPYLGNSYINSSKLSADNSSLKGIGCCAGIVKRKVRIVEDPTKAGVLKGEILVTSSTDPGWITLFSSISGIIVERGSLLSHSAIVSRELGVPCIVGVSNALKKLRDGDYIEMDGTTGVINIL